MTQNLNNAHWEYTKKKAVLIAESSPLIEIEFGRKATLIRFGNDINAPGYLNHSNQNLI
jgi:hypothetical protein